MGAWGHAPWDSDSAADWFGDLFDELPIAKKVEEALNLDPEDYADEIRAAAALLVMLGRTYVWPIDDIDRHLVLAISQLEKVQVTFEDEPDYVAAVAEEIIVLKSRLANTKDAPVVPQPKGWGNFWS